MPETCGPPKKGPLRNIGETNAGRANQSWPESQDSGGMRLGPDSCEPATRITNAEKHRDTNEQCKVSVPGIP